MKKIRKIFNNSILEKNSACSKGKRIFNELYGDKDVPVVKFYSEFLQAYKGNGIIRGVNVGNEELQWALNRTFPLKEGMELLLQFPVKFNFCTPDENRKIMYNMVKDFVEGEITNYEDMVNDIGDLSGHSNFDRYWGYFWYLLETSTCENKALYGNLHCKLNRDDGIKLLELVIDYLSGKTGVEYFISPISFKQFQKVQKNKEALDRVKEYLMADVPTTIANFIKENDTVFKSYFDYINTNKEKAKPLIAFLEKEVPEIFEKERIEMSLEEILVKINYEPIVPPVEGNMGEYIVLTHKLVAVRDFLREDWKTRWEARDYSKYQIVRYDHDDNTITTDSSSYGQHTIFSFKNVELLDRFIEICKNDIVKWFKLIP